MEAGNPTTASAIDGTVPIAGLPPVNTSSREIDAQMAINIAPDKRIGDGASIGYLLVGGEESLAPVDTEVEDATEEDDEEVLLRISSSTALAFSAEAMKFSTDFRRDSSESSELVASVAAFSLSGEDARKVKAGDM